MRGDIHRADLDNGLIVDLVEGVFVDVVRVWKDVRPAAGGVISTRYCWHRGDRGIRLYNAILAGVEAIARGENPPPIPKRFA